MHQTTDIIGPGRYITHSDLCIGLDIVYGKLGQVKKTFV